MSLPIGFFAPLPLPVMIPFMAMQSFAMMYAAGTGWQYGKRKISAMSNDDFNKLTPIELNAFNLSQIHGMIPSFAQSAKEMSAMNILILEQMRIMISDSVNYFGTLVADMFKGIGANFQTFGTHDIKDSDPTGITLISDTGQTSIFNPPEDTKSYRQSDFRNMTTEILEYKIANELRGSELSLAKHVLNARRQGVISDIDKQQGLPDVPSTTTAVNFTAWQKIVIDLQKRFLVLKASYIASEDRRKAGTMSGSEQTANYRHQQNLRDEAKTITLKLRKISNDFRNKDRNITLAAIALRKVIVNQYTSIT